MSKDVIMLHNENFWFKILVSVIIAIEALQNLEVLGIMKNELSSLPPGVGRLTELVELNVDSNYLTHLPKELCNLNRLQELSAATNNLMSIPQGSKQFLLFTLYCHYFSSLACFFMYRYNTSSAVSLHQNFVTIDNLLFISTYWIYRSWKDKDLGQHFCRQQSSVKLASTVLKVKEGQDKYWT